MLGRRAPVRGSPLGGCTCRSPWLHCLWVGHSLVVRVFPPFFRGGAPPTCIAPIPPPLLGGGTVVCKISVVRDCEVQEVNFPVANWRWAVWVRVLPVLCGTDVGPKLQCKVLRKPQARRKVWRAASLPGRRPNWGCGRAPHPV